MHNPPVFLISLDLELHWGGFEKWSLDPTSKVGQSFRQYFLNTRNVIPEMLNAFIAYEAQVTWATVGLLFHKSREEMVSIQPKSLPTFDKGYLSAYQYMQQHPIGISEIDDPFHYAPSLIEQISQAKGMEVGSHSYSHFYVNEPGQNVEQFQDDLIAAKKVAEMQGHHITSLVFPRNQINFSYLKTCYDLGFRSIRINPNVWYWDTTKKSINYLHTRLVRGSDSFLNMGNRTSFSFEGLNIQNGIPLFIPASRFLRPYQRTFPVLNELRMSRILNEMKLAAQQNEVYHLWWHPHNFGHFPNESMDGLHRILDHFANLQKQYGMISLNMRNLTSMVRNTRG